MNRHLALIKTTSLSPKQGQSEPPHVPDKTIIASQAKLMEMGGLAFKAIDVGDIAHILTALVGLAYAALQALSQLESDVIDQPNINKQPYEMLAIMRLVSARINDCASGEAKHYSDLYYLCSHLATDFLNADFDKAFIAFHDWQKRHPSFGTTAIKHDLPDLTDCLYE